MVSASCLSKSEVAQFGLEGPAHGQPMQLRLMGRGSRDIEEEQQQQLTRIGGINNRDNVYPALQQS